MKLRKKYQRRLNKIIRAINQNIANDDLWRGRFVIHQKASWFREYEDHSGGYLIFQVVLYDKKTGMSKDVWDTLIGISRFTASKLFWEMNNFIVEDVDVWRKELPYEERADYNSVKFTLPRA